MKVAKDKVFLRYAQLVTYHGKSGMTEISTVIPVSFGDCDPAGIVFYPNTYRWFDRLFHEWLSQFGGHARICKQLDAVGIGLLEAGAQFHHPMKDGDSLALRLAVEKWSPKTLRLHYEGVLGSTLCVTGHEVRALFRRGETGMIAANMSDFQKMVERRGESD
jgi:4-hydroxybenzoyl-CoA thioesterase